MLSFAFIALAIAGRRRGRPAFLGLSVEARRSPGASSSSRAAATSTRRRTSLIPCLVLFLTLLSLNLIGDKLQAKFAVKEGQV